MWQGQTNLENISICATADSLDELEVVLGVSTQDVSAGPRVRIHAWNWRCESQREIEKERCRDDRVGLVVCFSNYCVKVLSSKCAIWLIVLGEKE